MLKRGIVVPFLTLSWTACVLLMLTSPAQADIPLMINHQGLVKVNSLPFTGSGLFKFGFVDGGTGLWLWTNDGTHVGQLANTAFPDTAVTLPVNNGIYNVRLGDIAFINMVSIPSSVFNGPDVKLRVVFNDGSNGWQLLSPDQPVTSTGFAYHAATADSALQSNNSLLLQGLTAAQVSVPSGYYILGPTPTPPADFASAGLTVGEDWSTEASMPTARRPSAAAVNGIVYAIGGDNDSGALTTNEAYSPVTNSWTTKAPMPTARSLGTATAVNGIIYVIGGSLTKVNEAYDPVANTWSTKTAMPTARQEDAAAEVNGIIYVFGGYTGSTVGTNEAYNPVTNTWSTKAPMPTPRSSAGAAAVNGIIYVVGGWNGSSFVSVTEAYDPTSNTWSSKAAMPSARGEMAVAALGGRVYAIGGNGPQSVNTAYDPILDIWSAQRAMPTARYSPGAAAVSGSKVYVVGGVAAASAFVATNEVYTAPLYVYVKN